MQGVVSKKWVWRDFFTFLLGSYPGRKIKNKILSPDPKLYVFHMQRGFRTN